MHLTPGSVLPKRIEPVSLEFRDSHTPYSPLFQDIYFSPDIGIDESTHVYLKGSGFVEALEKNRAESFIVGEIGFGVGLNFLLTYRHFLEHAAPEQKLTFLSAEKYPVRLEDLQKLYSYYPELKIVSEQLLDQYPVLTPGFHSLTFDGGRVKLILMLGDAQEMFLRVSIPQGKGIQFWYWDGFSPKKNPEVFQETLFKSLIRISSPVAQASSFTTAGWVRQGLENAGFKVEKRPGIGMKRECIQVSFPPTAETKKSDEKPWFSAENLVFLKKGESVSIIGAGLSGTAIARALANRGFSVRLIDQESIAAHASGNTVGLYNVQLSRRPNPISRFSQLSIMHFIREIKMLPIATKKGILRLDALTEKEAFEEALSTSEYPESFFRTQADGAFFPECGILNPKTLCQVRANHPLIETLIAEVAQVEKTKNGFILKNSTGGKISESHHVVYATGAAQVLNRFLQHPLLDELPLKTVRGQVIHVSPNEESTKIPHSLVDSGYISAAAPEITGSNTHCIGATFEMKGILKNQEEVDSEKLLEEARLRHPAFSALNASSIHSIRVGHRLATPDKLPLIGPLCDLEKSKPEYEAILHGGRRKTLNPLPIEAREWLFLGMSSRGITYSSYGAEILASLMCGEVLPIESDLWEHLHPARLIIRKLKKQEAAIKNLG